MGARTGRCLEGVREGEQIFLISIELLNADMTRTRALLLLFDGCSSESVLLKDGLSETLKSWKDHVIW